MLHEKAASRNSKLEHENEVSETGLLQKLSEVPSFWGHCQIWLLCERDTKSCRTQFSLPLFCPFAKTQFYFFFLQTTHSLYSCLPWFLTELPTSPTGPSNSCIRFFFLVFFFFVLLPRASRSWTQTRGQDFEGESHETTHITGGENGRRREEKRTKYGCHFTNQVEGPSPLSCHMPWANGAHWLRLWYTKLERQY